MVKSQTSIGLDAPNMENYGNKKQFLFNPRAIFYNPTNKKPYWFNNRKWQVQNPYDKSDMMNFGSKRNIGLNLHIVPTIYL